MCKDRQPGMAGQYATDRGEETLFTLPEKLWEGYYGRCLPKWWLEPVEQPLYTKSDMSKCWDAALSHALKLKRYYKTFSGFIKSLKK